LDLAHAAYPATIAGWVALRWGLGKLCGAVHGREPACDGCYLEDRSRRGRRAATLPLKRFDIPAGPLDGVIEAYEKATGLKVKIVLPGGTLAGFNSPGVTGLYREDEALRRFWMERVLNYRAEDATTMLVGVQAKDTVSVTASVDATQSR
jgi:catecholate siderophore receptor